MTKVMKNYYKKMLTGNYNEVKHKCANDKQFISMQDKNGDTLLHYAVYDGELDIVSELLELGAYPNINNNEELTPLDIAAYNTNSSIFEKLLASSISTLKNDEKAKLLAFASGEGLYENVRIMLISGFNSNIKYQDVPIIKWAVQSSKLDVVKLICEYGADVNDIDDLGETALFSASADGYVDIIDYLIKQGGDIEKEAHEECTPLIIASCFNQIESVKMLLENKCNVNAIDDDGMTALLHAINYGYIEIVKTLLENGASITIKDRNGKGIMDYCERIENKKRKNEMKKILLLFQ